MHDIAEFLRGRDPFSGLDEAALDQMAAQTEVEFFASGSPIPQSEDGVRVVRRGAVELLDDSRVIDLLTEGELIGLPSALSGRPFRLAARAAEDSLTYLVPAAEVRPLVAGEASTPIAVAEPASGPVGALVGRRPVSCSPETSVREAARRMGEERVSSIVIEGEGERGIVTDRDLRARALAEGIPLETHVREVMSTPLIAVDAGLSVTEATMVMLDNDIRHLGVTSGSELIGVISDGDLLAAEARTPFVLRRAIGDASSNEELRKAASRMRSMVIELQRAGLPPIRIGEVISLVTDALTRRMIELSIEGLGEPPAEFAWLALGSHGRREPALSSDLDSGMAWEDPPAGGAGRARKAAASDPIDRYMQAIAEDVAACVREVGWRLDPHGVTASGAFSASSIGYWRLAIDDWLSRPTAERVLLAISITLDGRVVRGPRELDPKQFLHRTENRTELLAPMLRSALAGKPPTGFLRDIVVEHTGVHRGTVDLKHGGLRPVVDLARYGALKGDAQVTSTVERLRAAADAEALEEDQAQALEQAYELFTGLRLEHQIQQIEEGHQPDDHLDPKALDSLTRRYLRDAFREVAAIQRSLATELDRGRGRI